MVSGDDFEKNLTFADSLAQLYISFNKYDSAAKFFEIIAERVPNLENWITTADTYYEAFGFAMEARKRSEMAEKARFYFNKVLEKQPDNMAVKNKIAMTLVSYYILKIHRHVFFMGLVTWKSAAKKKLKSSCC